MIRNQKIKGTFICGPLFFKWMGVFQSWLDSFSIGVWTFIRNRNFLTSVVLYTGAHLLQFLNAVICSLITLFFKCIKLHQILFQFFTIKLAQALDIKKSKTIWTFFYGWVQLPQVINIFGRDYSNLHNPIPTKDINLQYIYKVYCKE